MEYHRSLLRPTSLIAMSIKTCPVCGKSFDPHGHRDTVCCCSICGFKRLHPDQVPPIVERICPVCGKSFQTISYVHQTFCSFECAQKRGNERRRQRRESKIVSSFVIPKSNWQRISDINDKALALGLSYGKYQAYLSMGLNPADFCSS